MNYNKDVGASHADTCVWCYAVEVGDFLQGCVAIEQICSVCDTFAMQIDIACYAFTNTKHNTVLYIVYTVVILLD